MKCDAGGEPHVWPTGIGSKLGRDFLAYLAGAEAFYAGRFDEARSTFTILRKSSDPWVSETAAYMVARNDLAAALAPAIDEWGGFDGAGKTDAQAAKGGQAALVAYLSGSPDGRYAASARGLQRRALWLLGDRAALGRTYAQMLEEVGAQSETVPNLIEEIDNKLLFAAGMTGSLDTPLLLATMDLERMRTGEAVYGEGPEPLSEEELAAQEPAFAGAADLFGLIQANRAFYADDDYRKVLSLLPDDARRQSYTPVQFSRQVLRGQALEALDDPNAAGFWMQLVKGVQDLYQRPAVELALAMNWERHGELARVFEKELPIGEGEIRMILMQYSAGADLLRSLAKRGDRPERERGVAQFMLLYKELSRGRYGDFVADLALVPAGANTDGYIGGWLDVDASDVPAGLFAAGRWSEDFPCPALAKTAATLARASGDPGALLCLGDFYRLNGFDGFMDEDRPGNDELGGAANEFGGETVPRQELYKRVIADRRATPTEKAYALYRAVWCYGPSGNNSCGGEDVPVEQRKAWFQRLKRDYAGSRWAKDLKYYW